MILFTRCIAVLTVLVGLAIMAVSAYAAKADVRGAYPTGGAPAAGQRLVADDVSAALFGVGAVEQASATGTSVPAVEATPTVPVRYAAPVGAAPATRAQGGRDNLSAGPRVWPVLSLKPRPRIWNLGPDGLQIPPDQLAVMQQVSLWTGIPWQIFAGVAKVESDFGRNMATSWAGAIGYGQFLPEMWDRYGNGGDPYDFRDVLPAMGRYLVAAGAPADIPGALYAYNHSWSYVALVLSFSAAYGYQSPGSSVGLIWPVIGPLTSFFVPGNHLGIDIDQTASPQAPVRAAHDGVVTFAGGDPCCGYGYNVVLVAPSGLMTRYAHLDVIGVTLGQTVRQGQPLGIVGCTGRCTGPHLHFEVIDDGIHRDPLDYLP